MAIKVAFYILNQDSSPKGRDLYACRIIEKAYNNQRKIYIHTSNLADAQNFDTQLWTFGDVSFVPHEMYTEKSNPNTPVIIGYGTPPQTMEDILVNLTPEAVPNYQQFQHIIEVIPNDENLKALARQRFQLYQKAGCTTEVFNV